MKVMKFPQTEIDSYLRTVSAILHLGNIKFESNKDLAEIKDKTPLNIAAQLFGVEANVLEAALIRPRIKVHWSFLDSVSPFHLFDYVMASAVLFIRSG